MRHEDILYHRTRASQEMNLGLACRSLAAARAHLQLSTLHLARAQALQDGRSGHRPPIAVA